MKRKSKPSPESPDSRELIHAVIAAKAYDLWELGGRPDNQAEATWLEAERDLLRAALECIRDLPMMLCAQPINRARFIPAHRSRFGVRAQRT
jgi:hypothetical protein